MMSPKISIIVAVYKAEAYLHRCVDSLLAQTFQEFEILLIDDGSPDHSGKICDDYANQDARIRVFHKENGGVSSARQCGMEHVRGEYVIHADPDDWVEEGAYCKLFEAAASKDVDIVKANYWEVTGGVEYLREQFAGYPYYSAISVRDYQGLILTIPTIWAAIYRREFLLNEGLCLTERPGSSYQDAAFCLRAWLSARKVALIPEAFVHYWNDRSDSATNSGSFPFAVCEEFHIVESWLKEDPVRCNLFMPTVYARKLETYRWNFNRLDGEERREFCHVWSEEFSNAQQHGWIKRGLFSQTQWDLLNRVISNPEKVAEMDELWF